MAELTDKQRKFVSEYLVDLNATQAAIRAGYSSRNASKIGPELLGKTGVRAAIEAAQAQREKRTLVTVDYVVSTLREVAERCLQRAPVTNAKGEQLKDADGKDIWRFDSSGANRALELLGKHVNAFGERKEETPEDMPVAIEVRVVSGRRDRE